jgi:eukaryotic-like serine/threonine-protein kinase
VSSFPRTFGPYVLLSSLGKGAAGEAFLARPTDVRRGVPTPVVIKILHERLADDDEVKKRFLHEAEIAVRVESRHIAPTYDVGTVGDTLYLALEYVAGCTGSRLLFRMIKQRVQAPLPVAIAIAVQCLRGLGALHALEVVHRDVSPKNVMIGDDGRVRLIDLGLGKSKFQDWKTRDGRVMGSPGYMPPEQILGERVDQRADLFAAGMIAWELLAGRRYFEITGALEMLRAGLETPYEAPSMHRSDAPDAIDSILERAMAPNRDDRFASADELSDALADAIAPASDRAIAAFVESVLGTEQEQRREEVQRLLDISAPQEEPELVHTRVLATRVGIRTPAPKISVKPTRRTRAPMIGALGIAALSVGLVAGVLGTREAAVPQAPMVGDPYAGPSAIDRQTVEPKTISDVLPSARAIDPKANPGGAIDPNRTAVRDPKTGPNARGVRPISREAVAKVKPPPPIELPPTSPEQRLAELDRRAQQLWKTLPPDDPRRDSLGKLLRDLSMTKRALPRLSAPETELRTLEQRLDAIER